MANYCDACNQQLGRFKRDGGHMANCPRLMTGTDVFDQRVKKGQARPVGLETNDKNQLEAYAKSHNRYLGPEQHYHYEVREDGDGGWDMFIVGD